MALQIAGTLFAAVSFSAANLAFKYIDPKDYSKESHRHNLMLEKFAKDHEAWSSIKHLELDITNKNLAFSKENEEVLLKKEPQFEHYYQSSKKLQNYKHAVSGVMGFGAAYGATKLMDFLL